MLRKKAQHLPTTRTDYPIGSFVETEKGNVFYIVAAEKRYRLVSRRCLDSWSPRRVIKTTEGAISHYRITAKMKFRNGSLIHNQADGKIYLIESGKRRHITSPDVFARIGAVEKEVVTVSQREINLHDEGEPLA
jgi:hypothetical protein